MDIGYAPFNVGAYSGTENDVLNKIETQLFGALELLQAYQEGIQKLINLKIFLTKF